MGLCIGASLMSFVELIDLGFNCLFISCRFEGKRVNIKEEAVADEYESETRLVKVEGLLSDCIKKNACLEAELSATRVMFLKSLDKLED